MPDQIMTAVAVALAGKATEAMFGGARDAFTALVRLVRERFGRDEDARRALESAENAPHDPAAVAALARELARVASADLGFDAEIRDLWPRIAAGGEVVNMVTGKVNGPVIQARDVQGGIRFGGS